MEFNSDLYLVGVKNTGRHSFANRITNGTGVLSWTESGRNGQISCSFTIRYAEDVSSIPRGAAGAVLCFSIDYRNSFEHIQKYAEIVENKFLFTALLGTHKDNENGRYVDQTEESICKERLGCICFEISNKTGQNVEIFERYLKLRAVFAIRASKISAENVMEPKNNGYPLTLQRLSPNTIRQSQVESVLEKSVGHQLEDSDRDTSNKLTIAVVGQYNSGKRSLIKRMCYYLGSQNNSSIYIGDGKTSLRFVSVNYLSYLNADCYGVLVVFRIDDLETYKSAYEIARCISNKFRFSCVVGTYRDRAEFRYVSVEQGKLLKYQMNGSIFFEVSTVTGENIMQLFKYMEVRILIEQNASYYQIELATSYGRFSQPIIYEQETKDFIAPTPYIPRYPEQNDDTGYHTYSTAQRLQQLLEESDEVCDDQFPDIQNPEYDYVHSSTMYKLDLESLTYEPYDRKDTTEELGQSQNPIVNYLTKSLYQSVANSYKPPQFPGEIKKQYQQSAEFAYLSYFGATTNADNNFDYKKLNQIENMMLQSTGSRLQLHFAPYLKKYPAPPPVQNQSKMFDTKPEMFENQQNPLQSSRAAILNERALRKSKTSAPRYSFSFNSQLASTYKIQDRLKKQEPVIIIEFEVGDAVLELPVKEDDNPYAVAKRFVATNSLDESMTHQITMLIIERLEQYHLRYKEAYMAEKYQKYQYRLAQYESNKPKWTHVEAYLAEKAKKPLFKFELYVGNHKQTIAYREGDDPKRLAANYCNILKLNPEQYYSYVLAKINESIALYYLQMDYYQGYVK